MAIKFLNTQRLCFRKRKKKKFLSHVFFSRTFFLLKQFFFFLPLSLLLLVFHVLVLFCAFKNNFLIQYTPSAHAEEPFLDETRAEPIHLGIFGHSACVSPCTRAKGRLHKYQNVPVTHFDFARFPERVVDVVSWVRIG